MSARSQRILSRHISPSDRVLFCLTGDLASQNLVALEDRVIIIKYGFLAGTTGGERVATIHYRDITGTEVNVGILNGVIEISTPSYPAKGKKSVWKTGTEQDPYLESNCLPVPRYAMKGYEPYLRQIRDRVDIARGTRTTTDVPSVAETNSR